MARFEREAKLLASLNHPNIASIYGFEESDGVTALVLELVEGPTLAERIAKGPVPVDETVVITRQMADALEAGHEVGVIHRDLKPANVKIKEDGTVKVLDYGLEKALEGESLRGANSELSQSPTLTRQGTQIGVILGTAAYMSPEQAKGKRVDRRADIWAFGTVVYEMLTGRKAFRGEDVSDTLAAVLRAEVDWVHLPAKTPPGVRRLLERCLTRDPGERLHDIADARLELRDARKEYSESPGPIAACGLARWAVAAIALGSAVIGGLIGSVIVPDRATSKPNARFSIRTPAPPVERTTRTGSWIAIAPDGSRIAYAALDGLYVRRLDAPEFRRLDATEGAHGPFFSPDGEWIAFFHQGRLKKISLATTSILSLCDAPLGRGGAWREDGTIIFSPDQRAGIHRVSSEGGVPRELSRPNRERNERGHLWPSLLPGGKHVFVTVAPDREADTDARAVAILSLETGEMQHAAKDARYATTGHIVFAKQDVLLAAPFDVDRMAIVGAQSPVLVDIAFPSGRVFSGQAPYALSDNGVLSYIPYGFENPRLELISLEGVRTPISAEREFRTRPSFSPDGRRVAVAVTGSGVWLLDVERGLLSRISTSAAASMDPVWSPDGSRLAATLGGELVLIDPEGDNDPEVLVTHSDRVLPGSWTPDGRAVLYSKRFGANRDIAIKAIDGDEQILLAESYIETFPVLSPDGRWLAYVSDENGRFEVFARAFPALTGKVQVSTSGGIGPLWSPDSRTLYYMEDTTFMAADVAGTANTTLRIDPPRALFLFESVTSRNANHRLWDIAPDGQHFLFVADPDETSPQIHVVLDGLEELRAIATAQN